MSLSRGQFPIGLQWGTLKIRNSRSPGGILPLCDTIWHVSSRSGEDSCKVQTARPIHVYVYFYLDVLNVRTNYGPGSGSRLLIANIAYR